MYDLAAKYARAMALIAALEDAAPSNDIRYTLLDAELCLADATSAQLLLPLVAVPRIADPAEGFRELQELVDTIAHEPEVDILEAAMCQSYTTRAADMWGVA